MKKKEFPKEFVVEKPIEIGDVKFKPGDKLIMFNGFTYGLLSRTLGPGEKAYSKKGETEGPFVGFTLEAIEEATTTEKQIAAKKAHSEYLEADKLAVKAEEEARRLRNLAWAALNKANELGKAALFEGTRFAKEK